MEKEERIEEINNQIKKGMNDLEDKHWHTSYELYNLYRHKLPDMSRDLFFEMMATGHVLLSREEKIKEL